MPTVRNAIEAFVSGSLDYGGLQDELQAAASSGVPRDLVFDELRLVDGEIGLSPALNNLIARAIDRHFGAPQESGDQTVPGDGIDETRPGRPRSVAKVDRAAAKRPAKPSPAEPAEDESEAAAAEDGAAQSRAAPPPETPAHRPPGDADQEPDPVADLPPIYAADDEESAAAARPGAAGSALLPEPGTVLADRYVLQSVLGRGGMGVVYRALDRRREEASAVKPFVAVKVLRRDLQGRPEARSRLFTEALQGLSLQHPNIVAVHDFDRDGELAFVTMELLEGERLRTLIVRSAPAGLAPHEAFAILRGILAAASHLHARGFVHRDLTPANILVTQDGVPKLLDFGLTRRPVRGAEPVLGDGEDDHAHTPAYASPELLDGKPPDPRDDVYALGVLAYELLTGKHPFGKLAADEASRKRMSPPAPKGLTHGQWRTLRSALSFRAERRPADARALLDGLALGPAPARSRRPGIVPGLLAGTAAGVLLTLAVIHPDGPIGRRLATPQTAAGPATPDTPVPAEPAAPSVTPPATAAAPSAAGDQAPPPAAVAPSERAPVETAAPTPGPARRTSPEGDVLTPLGGEPVATSSPPGESVAEAPVEAPARPPARAPTIAAPPPATPEAATPGPATDPRPGRLELASARYRVSEGTAVLIAEVRRREGSRGRVGFRWRTVPGTAGDGDDYVGVDWQRLELADGETSLRIFVPLVNDGLAENPETFLIEIGRPDGGASLGERTRAEVVITDDDPA